MVDHLQQKADEIKKLAPLTSGDLVLDIGSNDGTLLKAMAEPGVDLVGMDPSGAGFAEYYPAQARLIPDFFFRGTFPAGSGKPARTGGDIHRHVL